MTLASDGEISSAAKPLEARQVLVVDDDRELAEATADGLRASDHAVMTAYDSETAIERCGEFAPHVAIVDVGMRGDGGVELIDELRERYPRVRVVVTGRPEDETALRSLRGGAFDYLYKPVEIVKLSLVLERAFAHIIIERDKEEAERALAESQARFRDFAEVASDWFWETDAGGRYTFVSDTFFEYSGLRAEDLLGKVRRKVFPSIFTSAYPRSPCSGTPISIV